MGFLLLVNRKMGRYVPLCVSPFHPVTSSRLCLTVRTTFRLKNPISTADEIIVALAHG